MALVAKPFPESFLPRNIETFEKFVGRAFVLNRIERIDIDQIKPEPDPVSIADQQWLRSAIEALSQIGQFTAQTASRFGVPSLAPKPVLQPAACPLTVSGHRQHRHQSCTLLAGYFDAIAIRCRKLKRPQQTQHGVRNCRRHISTIQFQPKIAFFTRQSRDFHDRSAATRRRGAPQRRNFISRRFHRDEAEKRPAARRVVDRNHNRFRSDSRAAGTSDE
ncbi:hypothetical protein [Rhodopseudomonas sp.]|uniref:hypothetical protein n=1 Tax=Rhodopseudomonas sp. TaxID=1078 RepID=UPI0025D0CB0B|nr:hypothetical protein [Rhodopseudomonas sp.]